MPIDLAEYDDVVHRIYDAALEPSNWTGVIAHIKLLLGLASR